MNASQSEDPRIASRSVRESGLGASVPIAKIDLEAPWRWLNAGWSDLMALPLVSLIYGSVFALLAAGMWLGLSSLGLQSLMLALAGGFMLIGPVLGVGLYEASRRRAAGESVTMSDVVFSGLRAPDQLALLGLALLLVFIVWVQIAFLIFMMFFGGVTFPPMDEFIPRLLFTWQGVLLLVVGTLVGAILAALVFAMSVISAPMLIARNVGVADAVVASLRATRRNIKPMALWAALIAGCIALGVLTLSLGLIVIFPLIAYASWHAYEEIAGGGAPAA